MKVTEHIDKSKGKTLFSIEILPPIKGQNIQSIFDTIEPLLDYHLAFVDVTYHRQEVVYKELDSGLLRKSTVRKRPGTVAISAAIQNKYKIDAIPHIICGGFTKEETEDALIELNFLEIDNVLALRGDPLKGERKFTAKEDGNHYASDLVQQVASMNKGIYLDGASADMHPTDFCIGVAAYPEKHFESPNINTDLQYLKQKVDLGAEYIVTQMFFDNQKYFAFVKQCRAIGIEVPIIPGIKPLTTKGQLTSLPQNFYIDIPDALVKEVLKSKNNAEAREIGIKWAIQQCKELKEFGVPILHFYTMSKSETTRRIVHEVF